MVHEDVILIREDVIVKSGKLSHIKSLINKLENSQKLYYITNSTETKNEIAVIANEINAAFKDLDILLGDKAESAELKQKTA